MDEFEKYMAETYGLDELETAMTGSYTYQHMKKLWLASKQSDIEKLEKKTSDEELDKLLMETKYPLARTRFLGMVNTHLTTRNGKIDASGKKIEFPEMTSEQIDNMLQYVKGGYDELAKQLFRAGWRAKEQAIAELKAEVKP